MSPRPAMPVCARSMPGHADARAAWPGLKPSLRFHSTGLMCLPAALAGIHSGLSATRRPVTVLSSWTVWRSLGNGSRQYVGVVAAAVAAGLVAGQQRHGQVELADLGRRVLA